MAVRWKCPQCGSGVNAPSRLRTNATARFCLACSAKSPTLIERVAPKLEAKRAKSAERQKTKRERERAKEAAKYVAGGIDVRKSFARAQRLACWKRYGLGEYMKGLDFNLTKRGDGETSGRAWGHRKSVHISAGEDPFDVELAIVHELTHKAHFRLGKHRVAGRKRAAVHDAEFHDMLRVAACEFFGFDPAAVLAEYPKHGGARAAYSMDGALRAVRRQVDPEGYEAARRAVSERAKAKRKSGKVEFRQVGDRDVFEFELPGAWVGEMGLDDYGAEEGVEIVSSRRVGRGSAYLIRATLEGLDRVADRALDAWDSPYKSKLESFGEQARAFRRAIAG